MSDPAADIRVLRLTKEEEKRLIQRIEAIASYEELKRVQEKIQAQLGVVVEIGPGSNEVRTVRGLHIELIEQPGLCKKIRQSIPAAIRKCMENKPEIVYQLLNANDLLGG